MLKVKFPVSMEIEAGGQSVKAVEDWSVFQGLKVRRPCTLSKVILYVLCVYRPRSGRGHRLKLHVKLCFCRQAWPNCYLL